jgi:hypothetical protein
LEGQGVDQLGLFKFTVFTSLLGGPGVLKDF